MGLKGCTTYRPNAVTGSVLHLGRRTSQPVRQTCARSAALAADAVAPGRSCT